MKNNYFSFSKTGTFLFLSFLIAVNGHSYLSEVIIGGVNKGATVCIRPRNTGNPSVTGIYGNSPVQDVSTLPNGLLGPNMTCGFTPSPAQNTCVIAAGATIGLQWWHNSPGAADDIIDGSHKGPVIGYLAKSASGAGPVWFKIYEAGYDATRQKWATEDLKANRGLVTFTIPSDISPGDYLLRAELIALHDGDKPNGAQPYVHCVQLTITGSGTANPTGVAFPGAYQSSNPGIAFNLYTSYSSYTIPGPAIYRAGTTPTTPPTTPTTPPTTPTTPNTPNGSSSGNCNVGSEGCGCTSGGSCDSGLKCVSVSAGQFCISANSASSLFALSSVFISLLALLSF